MYPTVDEARALYLAIEAGLRDRAEAGASLPRVIVCPPFVSLAPLRDLGSGDPRLVRLGAQNCHWEDEGPYTGEISPGMLLGLVEYVMVGHSDRRAAGETDEQFGRKVAAVSRVGLVPILFVGEDEPGGDAIRQTEQRLRLGLSGIDTREQDVLVVYEPSWAIGAERSAPVEHIGGAVEHLKGVLCGMGSPSPTILYGGTVSADNIDDLAGIDILDGVGATRAGLDPDVFLRIVDRVASGSS
jgi:triosephosphate isomerase